MMRRALIYGTLAAVGTAAWMMLEFELGLHTEHAEVGRWTGFIGLLFPVIAIVLAMSALRRSEGALPMRRALAQSAAIGIVFAILGALTVWLYFEWVNPAFRVGGQPVDVVEQVVAAGLGGSIACVIIGAIAAFVLRPRSQLTGAAT
jgi:hypothetical protein